MSTRKPWCCRKLMGSCTVKEPHFEEVDTLSQQPSSDSTQPWHRHSCGHLGADRSCVCVSFPLASFKADLVDSGLEESQLRRADYKSTIINNIPTDSNRFQQIPTDSNRFQQIPRNWARVHHGFPLLVSRLWSRTSTERRFTQVCKE